MSVRITKSGPTVSESAINTLELTLEHSLPPQYREFLLEFNGGEPETNVFPVDELGEGGVIEFFGIREGSVPGDIAFERSRMAGRVPSGLLPIAEAEGGNLVCVSLQGQDRGTVYFWDHEEEADEDVESTYCNLHVIGSSFRDFWNSLRKFDPSQVELKEGQVEEAWIDPDLLRQLGDEESV